MSDNALYQLPLTIELKAPALFADTVGDENMVSSVDYIPGSVLLGAFAGLHIKEHGGVDPSKPENFSPFADLFLNDKVRFLNGYIQIGKSVQDNNEKDKDEHEQNKKVVFERSLPVPMSIQFGKKEKAVAEEILFRRIEDDENNGWELVTFDPLLKEPSDLEIKSGSAPQNAVEPTKYKGGYCLLAQDGETCTFTKVNVGKQYQIHHQRTNQRVGRSENSEIYNYESIVPRQVFKAVILGSKDELAVLKTLLKKNDNLMRLGRSRHTQYGNAKVTAGAVENYQDEAAAVQTTIVSGKQFILTCASDVVFDASVTKIDTDEITKMIKAALPQQTATLTCINAFFKINTVERYNAAWKARTPSQLCLVKGSCFVFEFGSNMDESIKSALDKIQQNGLGARRNEGYGRVLINWQGLPLQEKDAASPSFLKAPDSAAPDDVQFLLQGLLKQWLIEKAQVYASDIAKKEAGEKGFSKLTSTQLNKLKRMALKVGSLEDDKQTSDESQADNSKLETNIFEKFRKNVAKLASQDDLKKIYVQNKSFYDFLRFDHFSCLKTENWLDEKEPDPFAEKIIEYNKSNSQFKELLKHANSSAFLQDDKLHNALFQTFYDTLFTLLDKSSRKKSKKKPDEDNQKGEENHG